MKNFKFFNFVTITYFVSTLLIIPSVSIYAMDKEWKPEKPIRIIVADNPGSMFDLNARFISSEMTKQLGTAVIVDPVPGAGQMAGIIEGYRSKPDGYTILFCGSNSMVINQFLRKAPYDYKEFRYLGSIINTALTAPTMITAKGKGLDSWEDLLNVSKSRPIRWATVGKGTFSYIGTTGIAHAFGIDSVFVTAYEGSQVVPAVIRGEVDGALFPLFLAAPVEKSGDVNIVLFVANNKRNNYPNVPITSELGHPELMDLAAGYHLFLAPPGTPDEIVNVLAPAVYQATKSETTIGGLKRMKQDESYFPLTGKEVRTAVENSVKVLKEWIAYTAEK